MLASTSTAPLPPQFEDPAEALQALRTQLDVRRALALDWVQAAVGERLAALAGDKGKGAANGSAANGSAATAAGRAARAAAAQHPLAAPAEVLERLRKELRLSKLQAGVAWRVLLYVGGKGEPGVKAGLASLIRAAILAEVAGAKGDAQGATAGLAGAGAGRGKGAVSRPAGCGGRGAHCSSARRHAMHPRVPSIPRPHMSQPHLRHPTC